MTSPSRSPDLEAMADLSARAALAGGEIVRQAAASAAEGTERKGRAGDYVTDADRASERAVGRVLRGETGLPVLGEEEGGDRGERYFVVDPLDGTRNFIHGVPVVGVSVALVERG